MEVKRAGDSVAGVTAPVDLPWALLVRVSNQHALPFHRVRRGRKPEELRARREWIRLVQDSWGLTISETARLLGVDRCAVRGARR